MATKSVKSLSKQLAGVAKQAKSLGINTSKADAMVKQTKREGSKSFSGSSEEKAYLSSIPAQMTAETPANIPTLTSPDIGNVVGQNNTALSSVLGDTGTTYDATKGQFVTSPATTAPTDNFQSLFQQATQMGNAAFDEMGTGEQRLAQLEKENKLKQKQQAVNETTGQINAVVAQSQAQQLALEGQGRGQTGAFIGGEQARINREAAIAALPLQAKLAAEQGALDLAQSHIDKMFQVQSQDALAKYQYKSKLIESVYSFATGQEQRRLDAIKAKEDRAYDEQKTNLAYQRSLASDAASYGLGSVSASILKLDPKSPTFNQDIAGLQSRVMKPAEPKAPKAPDLQNFGTTDNPDWRQYDYETGTWNEVDGVGTGTGSSLSKVQKAKVSEALVANEALYKDISEYKKLLDYVGFEGSTWGATNLGKFDALRGRITTTLKKAETLGTLDAGVLQLVDQLIGKTPEKSGLTQNIGGFASRRVSSSLDTQLRLIQDRINTDKDRLGGNQLQFQPLEEDTTNEIYSIFGMSQSTNNGTFDPDEWLK